VATRLTLDRFEGTGKDIAVLLTDGGRTINVPRALLPKTVRPGDVLKLTIEPDAAATERLARETAEVQNELESRDPGGDVKL
jgi:hypothetical protein